MPRRAGDDDEWDDEWDDEPGWVPDDDEAEWRPADDDDDEPTVACPHCGEHVHADSQRCPHCEQYISEEDEAVPAGPSAKPAWIVVGCLACLFVVYRWIVGG